VSRKFLVALHFEANVEIEADNEEDAIGKGHEMMNARHVYKDSDVSSQLIRTYCDGMKGLAPPMERPEFKDAGVASISDPAYVCDNDPVILEEIKDNA